MTETKLYRFLNELVDKGMASTDEYDGRSFLALTERGEALQTYAKNLRKALKGDEALETAQTIETMFREDQESFNYYLRRGCELYSAVSPGKRSKNPGKRYAEISSIIREYQDQKGRGIRPTELEERMQLSGSSIERYLSQMTEASLIERNSIAGHRTRYTVTNVAS